MAEAIEWIESQSGVRVPKLRGRLLASRIDPVQEAQEWYLRRIRFTDKVKTIFILGVGGGFHIVEAAQRTSAEIVVIESSAELTAAVMPALLEQFPDRVRVICTQRAVDLRSDEVVRAALATSFVVLEHPASVSGADREFYSEASAMLIARDWVHLTWQWKLKGLPDMDSQPRISRSEKPLTIYDLEKTELVQSSVEREKMLLRALRELVK